jgi:P27 family predicted phage terminase small subunit
MPANVRLLHGNASRRPIPDGEVHPDIAIPHCPKHLLPEARKFWKRITPELEKLGLIALIDQAAISQVCQWWAWWVWHDSLLQRDIKIAAEKREAWETAEEAKRIAAAAAGNQYNPLPWTGGDGYQVPTVNGNLTYSPHWVGAHKASDKLDKALASFGMSPSSRGRVTPSSRTLPLPGMPEAPRGGFNAL